MCDGEVGGVHGCRGAGGCNAVKGSAIVVLVCGELGSKVRVSGAD